MDDDYFTHVVIPDTQVKPDVPVDHLLWAGRLIVDRFAGEPNIRLIHLGDHADMPSLSSYDKGKKAMEGRRYLADIAAANDGFSVLNQPLFEYNQHRTARKKAKWKPDRHVLLGNHEDRIRRAVEADATLDGLLSVDMLNYAEHGWAVHPFLKPVFLDGVGYSHYFANPMSGRPYAGVASTRLKTIGHTFTMGHQQAIEYAVRDTKDVNGDDIRQHGLVAGAFYLHDEEYKGHQGNGHWRGMIVKHMVRNGEYDLELVSMRRLERDYG